MATAEVYARIDQFGEVPSKLNDGSSEGLAELDAGADLQVLYEPETLTSNCSDPALTGIRWALLGR
jgi:hypothetical protein